MEDFQKSYEETVKTYEEYKQVYDSLIKCYYELKENCGEEPDAKTLNRLGKLKLRFVSYEDRMNNAGRKLSAANARKNLDGKQNALNSANKQLARVSDTISRIQALFEKVDH